MITNAKEEFIKHIEGRPKVMCARIYLDPYYIYPESNEPEYIDLLIGYDSEDFDNFLKKLDFTYNRGYGSQELNGLIWYKYGSWSERSEYDGSEGWSYKNQPTIPISLRKAY